MTEPAAEPAETESQATEQAPRDRCPVAWCPVCMAVTAAQPLQPEVFDHLLKAGTEMLLALRALVDARAHAVAPEEDPTPATRLEKIDLG